MIQLRILSGIDNGVRNDFHPVHLLCIRRQKQGYGSRPAVQVPYNFFSCQSCVCPGRFIQRPGLVGIDLVKGQRGYPIPDRPDCVLDCITSPERPVLPSENNVRPFLVGVQDNPGDNASHSAWIRRRPHFSYGIL